MSELADQQADAVLEAARQRLRAEWQRAPKAWQAALEELEAGLFEGPPRLEEARRRHGLLGARHTESFRAELGCKPAAFLRRLRLEAADELIQLGALPIWMVARLTGFRSSESLRAAQRREKTKTSVTQQEPSEKVHLPPARSRRAPEETVALRRLLGGAGDPQDTAAEVQRLEAKETLADESETFATHEASWAETFWNLLRQWSPAEWQSRLAGVPFETPALFEHLCQVSRAEGRDDRQHGVRVAELALAALEAVSNRLQETRLKLLQAKGWACLGNAKRLALDYKDAEVEFTKAAALLKSIEAPAELRAELLYYRSCLRRYEHRFNEALKLAEEAIALHGGQSDRLEAELLLARGHTYQHLEENDLAANDFETALGLLNAEQEPYLSWVAHHNLATVLSQANQQARAEEWLKRARPLAARLGQVAPWCHTLWLEGLMAARRADSAPAIERLQEACEGFRGLAKPGYFSVAALDLALVFMSQGQPSEATSWVLQALPHLETLCLEAEGVAAIALLREALASQSMSTALLERLRRCAGRAAGAPEL